jgi:hypothetical protein
MDGQKGNPDGQQRVDGRRVPVIGSFGRIAPSWTLDISGFLSARLPMQGGGLNEIVIHLPIELVEVFRVTDEVKIDLGVSGDLIDMAGMETALCQRG